MGVTLIELSSLHAAYGPADFLYILVVIETTQTCRVWVVSMTTSHWG